MTRAALILAFVGGVAGVSAQDTSPRQPSFEVASVKRNVSTSRVSSIRTPSTGVVSIVNAPLRAIIRQVYGVRDYQIVGAPAWIDDERFDITARPPIETPSSQIAAMMRQLLADRFRLRARRSTSDQQLFSLVVVRSDGRLGPQIATVPDDCAATIAERRATPPAREGRVQCGERIGLGDVALGGRPLSRLLAILEEQVGSPVIDRTGLTGLFDLVLRWNPSPPAGTSATVAADESPSIFAAIELQLGLKLESTRGPVDVLMIDSVERPIPD